MRGGKKDGRRSTALDAELVGFYPMDTKKHPLLKNGKKSDSDALKSSKQ